MRDMNKLKEIYNKNISIMWGTPSKITCDFLDAYCENINDIPILREAKAIYNFWTKSFDVFVFPEDKICGFTKSNEVAGFNYGGGTWINLNIADEYINRENLSPEKEKIFRDKLQIIENHRYIVCREEDYTPEELKSVYANAATSTWFGGHMILDYETVLSVGLNGYEEKIKKHKNIYGKSKKDFYDALEIMLKAVKAVIYKFAKIVGDGLLDVPPKMREDLLYIAENPPDSFVQALQLVWILHVLNGSDSFGRFDFYLKPFFDDDIKSGVLTLEEAYDLIIDFWFKLDSVNAIQNMTIGGLDYNGNQIYSELTELCIKATSELGFKGPNLCLRITKDMPQYIWTAALDSIKSGIGLPALYNDELVTENLLNFGYDIKYARGYCFAGCSQLMIPGVCNFLNDIGMMNAAKIAEIALYDGFDPRTKKQVGLHTGTPEDIKSFDEVLTAYKKQLDYFCQVEIDIHEKEYKYRLEREGYAMRTLFIGDCIENGRNIFDGGARFNNIELEVIGITNTADHLYAIKKLVFDTKIISLPELAEILKSNWDDHEYLRKLALKCDKFGNDKPEVDEIRTDITSHIYAYFNNAKSSIGGIYIPGEVIFTAHDWCGAATGATADGRFAYTVLADSAGASQGLDMNGPTALMNSVLKLPTDKHLLTTTVTNIKFPVDIFKNETVMSKIQKLFEIFFNRGGMQLQVNVCDAETLRKAQKNPQEYASLIVRVGGYSDYFVNISKALQDEIIVRSEQKI
ncbi:MAG: hypothetical protein FWF92_11280 [Oscillospiraceae bacterium]|nr:hypothetical protein [Oscillospiraceae bacterium]